MNIEPTMSYEIREVLETVRMTEMERFDIRTITLGISLRDCSSVVPQTVRMSRRS